MTTITIDASFARLDSFDGSRDRGVIGNVER
jgi:hypothetical protein